MDTELTLDATSDYYEHYSFRVIAITATGGVLVESVPMVPVHTFTTTTEPILVRMRREVNIFIL